MKRQKDLKKIEKDKQRKILWKGKIYPIAKVAMIFAICASMIAPTVSGTLLANADDAAEVVDGITLFQEGDQGDGDVQETPVADVTVDPVLENGTPTDDQGNIIPNNNGIQETTIETPTTVSGNKVDNIPVNGTVSENTVSGKTVSGNTVSENSLEVVFNGKEVIDGIEIHVEAPEGVFPIGSALHVIKIENKDEEIAKVIEDDVTEVEKAKPIATFDITIRDKDGNELQPDNSKGEVKVSFKNIDTAEAESSTNKEIQVFHVEDDLSGAEVMNTEVTTNEVSFEAEHFSLYTVVNTETAGLNINSKDLVASTALTMAGGTAINTSGSSMSLDDEYQVTYTLKDTLVFINTGNFDVGNFYYLQYGTTYALPQLPSILKIQAINGSMTWNATATTPNRNTFKFGTITATEGGEVNLLIESKENIVAALAAVGEPASAADSLTGVRIGIHVKLNDAEVGTNETKEFSLGNPGTNYSVSITENVPKAPTVEKIAVAKNESTGVMDWKIKITNARNPKIYENGLTIEDTIGNTHNYVANSLKMVVNGNPPTSISDGNVNASDYSLGIPYTKEQAAVSNAVTEYTYQTKVDDLAFLSENMKEENEATCVNTVTIKNNTDNTPLGTATGETKLKKTIQWTTKTGGTMTRDGNKAIFEWKVTVKNNGISLKDVVIHDTFSDYMTFGTVKSVTQNGTEIGATATGRSYAGVPGKTNEWEYKFDSISAGVSDYVIIYTTEIADYPAFQKTNHATPSNSVYITFDYQKGNGTEWFHAKGPTVSQK